MRNLLFKNQTSSDRKRRIIASSEQIDKGGAHTVIHRHFICLIREVKDLQTEQRPAPYLYVVKERNTRKKIERFFCRLKGSMYVKGGLKVYLVVFSHSLKIHIRAVSHAVKYA